MRLEEKLYRMSYRTLSSEPDPKFHPLNQCCPAHSEVRCNDMASWAKHDFLYDPQPCPVRVAKDPIESQHDV